MVNMDKKSGLLQIIKYGDDNQRDVVFHQHLKPILVGEGDFTTATDLVREYPDLFNGTDSKKFILQVSNSFFTTLKYDDARNATALLVGYMRNKDTPNKDVAKDRFKLFSILGLHQTMVKYLVNSGSFEDMPEFKDITYMYDAMHTLQTIRGGSYHAFSSLPTELRSAIGVSHYLSKVLDKDKLEWGASDIEDADVVKDTKIEFWKAKDWFDTARNGYHTSLEDHFKAAKKGTSEARFIAALMPCAVMNHLIKEYEVNLLSNYKRRTDFEKGSEVFAAVETLAPLFSLEAFRQTLSSDKELTVAEADTLFNIEKSITPFYKPFATTVKDMHLAKLCQIYAKNE
jgi:hypothetical protein